MVENSGPQAAALVAALRRTTAHRDASAPLLIGITGSPGAGKSSLVAELVRAYRDRELRVAVLAVDPSSPFTGGAVLGDRIRMQEHATDPGVFIRSMAARGHLGGLAAATAQAMQVLIAAGFEALIVETVGVGQSEVDIANACDSVVVVVAPGMGDAVQAAKAGVLEIANIFVVNKADREGAESTARELRQMIALGDAATRDDRDTDDSPRPPAGWRPCVVLTTANRSGGAQSLVEAIDRHQEWLTTSGHRGVGARRRVRAEIIRSAMELLRDRLLDEESLDTVVSEVVTGELDGHAAALRMIASLTP